VYELTHPTDDNEANLYKNAETMYAYERTISGLYANEGPRIVGPIFVGKYKSSGDGKDNNSSYISYVNEYEYETISTNDKKYKFYIVKKIKLSDYKQASSNTNAKFFMVLGDQNPKIILNEIILNIGQRNGLYVVTTKTKGVFHVDIDGNQAKTGGKRRKTSRKHSRKTYRKPYRKTSRKSRKNTGR
jgi:hypothetical protein